MENSKAHEIAEAAISLFYKKGYHATSMQDIADHVGLQKGSLYYHISSKEELLQQITEETINGFVNDLEHIVTQNLTSRAKLEQAIQMHLARVTANIPMAAILFRELFSLSDDPNQIIKNATNHYLDLFAQIVKEGMDEGEFKQGDPRLAALAILGSCNWVYRWYQEGGTQTSEEIAKYITNLWISGLINNN